MKKRDAFSEINITPLTDIFLVLLIIMMVVAPLLSQQGLNLMVPSNVEKEQLNKDVKIMTISVSVDGKYSMNQKEIEPDQLTDFIKEKSKKYKDGLLIQPDGNSTHGAVVKLMDAARNAGVTSVSISDS